MRTQDRSKEFEVLSEKGAAMACKAMVSNAASTATGWQQLTPIVGNASEASQYEKTCSPNIQVSHGLSSSALTLEAVLFFQSEPRCAIICGLMTFGQVHFPLGASSRCMHPTSDVYILTFQGFSKSLLALSRVCATPKPHLGACRW